MRRITRIALLAATILVGGLVAGTVISRASASASDPTVENPIIILGWMTIGGTLVAALAGSQNSPWTRQTKERQELDRLQDEFIQNVAHELRTPLSLVRGYVNLLTDEQLDKETRQRAAAITKSRVEELVKLVEAITTLHEVKPDNLNPQSVDLADLARIAVQMVQQKARRAGVKVLLHTPPDLSRIAGDPSHLLEALKQLLGNAIKFSPDGGTVTLRLSTERGRVRVEIADQGIGIPAGKLERIFDRFYQVDGSTTRRFGGLGLGLAIVKAVIEAHDGHIWASSAGDGQGSTFVFTVPTRAARRLTRPHPTFAKEGTFQIRKASRLQKNPRPRLAAVYALPGTTAAGKANWQPGPSLRI